MKLLRILSILLLFCTLVSLTTQSKEIENSVQSIEIHTVKSGWGHQKARFLIQNLEGIFKLNGNKIDGFKVAALLKALQMPVVTDLNKAIHQTILPWWGKHGVKTLKENKFLPRDFGSWSKEQKELFWDTAKDLDQMAKVFMDHYSGEWTDDYPKLAVKVTKSNGEFYFIRSKSQKALMLPFEIEFQGKNYKTYNPHISVALSKLLPKNALNKRRLSYAELAFHAGGIPALGITQIFQEEWNQIEVERSIGEKLKPIKAKYDIISSVIYRGGSYSIDLNGENGWEAKLKRKNTPKPTMIELFLSMKKNDLRFAKQFLAGIDRHEKRVNSETWISKKLSNSENKLMVRYVNDRSLTDKAISKLREDLSSLKMDKKLRLGKKELEQSTFFVIDGPGEEYSRWIALDDGRTILWQYSGPKVLDWSKNRFKFQERYGQKLVLRVVSQNGKLLEK